MGITSLRRWHWVAIALAVGLTHGAVWQAAAPDLADGLDDFEAVITDQARFEHAVVTEVQGVRLFKDLTVRPQWVRTPGGAPQLVHLVTGTYWDGTPQRRDGQLQARWAPACFVAPTPYPRLASGGPLPFNSVREYLQSLGAASGVRFTYAWWWWATRPMFISVCAALVVIGGVWPTVINLLNFGTLSRPADERGVSLWQMRPAPDPDATVAPPAPVCGDALQRLEAELEAGLRGADNDAPAMPARAQTRSTAAHPAIPPLLTSPVVVVPASAPQDRHFGADRADFYPTELHYHCEIGRGPTS